MVRLLVIVLVVAIVAAVAMRVWRGVAQLRVGAIPDDLDVPSVRLVADRGWQVTRKVDHGVATIRVEHPAHGERARFDVQLRDPGAVRELERAMADAGELARGLAASEQRQPEGL
jgi:hypothetical protein